MVHKLEGKTKELEIQLLLFKFQKRANLDIKCNEYIHTNPNIQVFVWYGGGSAEVKLYLHGVHTITSYFNFDNIIEEIQAELDV